MQSTNTTQKDVSLLEQLLDGLRVGIGESHDEFVVCDRCGTYLREGSDVTAYAYSQDKDASWDVRGVYCSHCSKTEISTETKGTEEAVVQAHLALLEDAKYQTASLVLADPEALDYSPTEEGTEPQTVAVTKKEGH
ncbi:hypothetical protein ACEU6E_10760 (plasmid) [Halorutilales archaeon Cl-col2-1]